MRAIYLPEYDSDSLNLNDEISIGGDNGKHLIKVTRIKVGEEILLLNGKGLKAHTKILEHDKKNVRLRILKIELIEKYEFIDIAIACPKRDAFVDIVRACVELGVSKIIPMRSKYSQLKEISNERMDKIIESGMIQSNNPFFLKFEKLIDLKDLINDVDQYDHVFYLNYSDSTFPNVEKLKGLMSKKILLILGPEGGFSMDEELEIKKINGVESIALSPYILKSPTAAIAGVGLLFGAAFSLKI